MFICNRVRVRQTQENNKIKINITLVLDKYIPERMLQNLDKCLVKLKSSN
jgi:hypothetical protein